MRIGRVTKRSSYPGTRHTMRIVPPAEGSDIPRTKPDWGQASKPALQPVVNKELGRGTK